MRWCHPGIRPFEQKGERVSFKNKDICFTNPLSVSFNKYWLVDCISTLIHYHYWLVERLFKAIWRLGSSDQGEVSWNDNVNVKSEMWKWKEEGMMSIDKLTDLEMR